MQHLNNLKIILRCNIVFLIMMLFMVIYVLIFTVIIKYESVYSGNETKLIGRIKEYSINGNKLQMTITAQEDVIATYYIKTEDEKLYLLKNIEVGNSILANGTLKEPMNNTVPNNFNYKNYLYNQKIFYLFDVDNYDIKNNNNFLDKIKDYLIKRAYNLENGDYLLVLVLGDKSLVSSEEYENYQINGTSHLLAISGSHVAVLLMVFSFLLKKFKDIPKLIILSAILIFFGFLIGFQAAVCRAIIFFILNNINKIGKFNYSNLQVLFVTAFILVLINPFIIYDLGFIYSFVVCGGIIYNSDKITGNYFSKLFKMSTISFLYSLPISAYINYEVNLLSILVNMIFVPWISIIIFPLAIITFIFPFINPIFQVGLNITRFLNQIFTNISIFINIPKMSLAIVFILFLLIILCKNNIKYIISVFCVLILVKLYPLLNGKYFVYYLDVGQGDCILLISPHQKDVIMIDTGGKITYDKEEWEISNKSYNLSDNTIKFLKSLGITKIDYLIITHGDFDHAGEAINIVDKLNVKNVIFNNDSFNDLESEIINILYKKNINYYKNIQILNTEYSKLYFLNDNLYDNENDNSNVIYMEFNSFKMLFMGDAGVDVEEDILKKYKLKNIDVLKVGHHGSKSSTSFDFVKQIMPRYSVISVGRNNRYNHPNQEVLDNLNNSTIYRTDINGTIELTIYKNKLDIMTYEP